MNHHKINMEEEPQSMVLSPLHRLNLLKYVKIFVIVDKNYAYELVGMQYEEM